MEPSPIDYLEQGKIEILDQIFGYDLDRLIEDIRNNPRRNKIVRGFLPRIKEIDPYFVFGIIYDMEEYKELVKKIMFDNCIDLNDEELINMLNNSSLGLEYLNQRFDAIIMEFKNDLDFLFEYMFNNFNKCKNLIEKLKNYPDLNIRFLFMTYMIKYEGRKIPHIYDDITKYLVSICEPYEPKLMDMSKVTMLAKTAFDVRNISLFKALKEYIFKTYPANNLAELLLCGDFDFGTLKVTPNKRGIKEFERDATRYFTKASSWRLQILKNYSRNVSKELLEQFKKYLLLFQKNGEIDSNYEHLDTYGLTRLLETYVDKYLELSHDKTHEFVAKGSTASCYRIGDFSFKLVRTKWSYEQTICPNIYLALPNLEEDYIRKENGVVEAGIEVQKFLRRNAKNVPDEIFKLFNEELNRLGYYSTDTLINGGCGDNTRLLDSYLEAGVEVPDWFKEYPLVLVDRDRIYSLKNKHPKQRALEW